MSTFSVNTTGAPAFVFSPLTGVTQPPGQTLKVTNLGTSLLYAGPLATLSTPGSYPAPIPPGQHLYLNQTTAATYVSAGFSAGTVSSTLSSSTTAGTSSFTVGSTTGYAVGSQLLVGSVPSSREVITVSGTTATAVTATTALLFDHVGASTVSTATAIFGQALVVTGAGI